jgi:TonB family protein
MSKDKQPYRSLSEQDIRDYLAGKISGKKAHEIERFLLNNPFEKEAMEGFEGYVVEDIRHDLDSLRKKIRKENYRTAGFLKIAATIALLLVSIATIWFYMDNFEQPSDLALQDPARKNDHINPQERKVVPPPSVLQDDPVVEEESVSNFEEEPVDQIVSSPEESIVLEQAPVTENSDAMEDQLILSEEGEKVVTNEEVQSVQDNQDIAAGTIQEEEMEIEDSPVNNESQAIAIQGLAATSATANGTRDRRAKRAERMAIAPSEAYAEGTEEALFADRSAAFYRYVDEHLNYPDEARQEGLEGNVILDLFIAASGVVEGIQIVNGISEECNEEAIRLVKEGPAWEPTTQNGTAVKDTLQVTIPFVLP